MKTMDEHLESDAARLDRLLAEAAPPPAVPAALERRILADFDRQATRWTFARLIRRAADAVWPDAPLWQPATAFALALIAGTGFAAFMPFDVPQQDDASAQVFALDTPADTDVTKGL